IQIFCIHIIVSFQKCRFYPFKKSSPKFASNKNQWKFINFMGLDQRQSFEQLIKCTKTTWHYHKTLGVFYEHYFSNKEIIKIDAFIAVYIWIVMLFKRKCNIQAHGSSTS